MAVAASAVPWTPLGIPRPPRGELGWFVLGTVTGPHAGGGLLTGPDMPPSRSSAAPAQAPARPARPLCPRPRLRRPRAQSSQAGPSRRREEAQRRGGLSSCGCSDTLSPTAQQARVSSHAVPRAGTSAGPAPPTRLPLSSSEAFPAEPAGTQSLRVPVPRPTRSGPQATPDLSTGFRCEMSRCWKARTRSTYGLENRSRNRVGGHGPPVPGAVCTASDARARLAQCPCLSTVPALQFKDGRSHVKGSYHE